MSDNNGRETWQGYSRDGELDLEVNLEHAALAFREKFGHAPIETRWAGAVILAGPIGEIPEAVPRSLVEARERAQQLALQLEV